MVVVPETVTMRTAVELLPVATTMGAVVNGVVNVQVTVPPAPLVRNAD